MNKYTEIKNHDKPRRIRSFSRRCNRILRSLKFELAKSQSSTLVKTVGGFVMFYALTVLFPSLNPLFYTNKTIHSAADLTNVTTVASIILSVAANGTTISIIGNDEINMNDSTLSQSSLRINNNIKDHSLGIIKSFSSYRHDDYYHPSESFSNSISIKNEDQVEAAVSPNPHKIPSSQITPIMDVVDSIDVNQHRATSALLLDEAEKKVAAQVDPRKVPSSAITPMPPSVVIHRPDADDRPYPLNLNHKNLKESESVDYQEETNILESAADFQFVDLKEGKEEAPYKSIYTKYSTSSLRNIKADGVYSERAQDEFVPNGANNADVDEAASKRGKEKTSGKIIKKEFQHRNVNFGIYNDNVFVS